MHYVSTTETNRLMVFIETVAAYSENRTENTDTVRTSQETHYVSATEPNRLMLFGESSRCLLWEPYGTHAVRTSQETHYVSSTETNRLMMFVETVGVYCENHKRHIDTVRTPHETHYLSARDQPVNTVWGNSRCLLWEPYGTQRYIGQTAEFVVLKRVVHIVTTGLEFSFSIFEFFPHSFRVVLIAS
jgi:hypothetical protein